MEFHALCPNFYPLSLEKTHNSEYELVLNELLRYISNHNEVNLDEIQIDYRLVDSLWMDVVIAVKNVAKMKSGINKFYDVDVIKALRVAINKSEIKNLTCGLLEKYSYNCKPDEIYPSDPAFQPEYFGKEWKQLIGASDAGLHEGMGMSIGVKRIDRGKTASKIP